MRVRAVIEERARMERELETLRTALAEGQLGMTAAQADLKALQATVCPTPISVPPYVPAPVKCIRLAAGAGVTITV